MSIGGGSPGRVLRVAVIAAACAAAGGCASEPAGDRSLSQSFAASQDRGAVRVFEKYGGAGNFSARVRTPGGKPLMSIRMDCEGPGAIVVQLRREGAVGSSGGSIACDDPDDEPARVGAQELGADAVVEVKQTNQGDRWSVAVDLYDEQDHSDR